ncbi:hypothetical protein NC651_027095 [Populus alba x Populus x berolinensis]|nr:hypothetical protein NC651_027095 [Populus alba x Populus x berolinensis]
MKFDHQAYCLRGERNYQGVPLSIHIPGVGEMTKKKTSSSRNWVPPKTCSLHPSRVLSAGLLKEIGSSISSSELEERSSDTNLDKWEISGGTWPAKFDEYRLKCVKCKN